MKKLWLLGITFFFQYSTQLMLVIDISFNILHSQRIKLQFFNLQLFLNRGHRLKDKVDCY